MADRMISKDEYNDRDKVNELLYFGAVMCDILEALQPMLKKESANDPMIKQLLSIKNKWTDKFNER